MSQTGETDIRVTGRRALLDALQALAEHRDAVVLVGAQAIYLHTGDAPVALAESTKDSDLAIDPKRLGDDPLLEEAMRRAGFVVGQQPGRWLSPDGIPVDLMVPELLAGKGSRRSGKISPHDDQATRRATGLEAAVVDHQAMTISALDPLDSRQIEMKVASPAALLVAKLHKLGERQEKTPDRLIDKDAHDVYRLLVAMDTAELAHSIRQLVADKFCGPVSTQALVYLEEMFGAGPASVGAVMAGRAEQLVGDPANVSASAAALAADLLAMTGDKA
jgi:hypothetical protein